MYSQVTLDVPDEIKDAVIGELSDAGAAGIWEHASSLPGLSRLTAYFGGASAGENVMSRVRAVFDRGGRSAPAISSGTVEECDWNEEWKKSYTSFPVGNDFFVIPSWVNAPCPDDRLPIRIDPGRAFGTGTHQTTQLSMEALERWVEPHHVVLDVGAGSGILAIAARLLGARRVFACDIDPVAAHVAAANIALNRERDIWTFCGSVDSARDGSIDLLLANLTADLIIELFAEFDRILAAKGIAVFSGILNEQREEILEACRRSQFIIHEEIARGEWLVLVAERHGS